MKPVRSRVCNDPKRLAQIHWSSSQFKDKTFPEGRVLSFTGGVQSVLGWFLKDKWPAKDRSLIPNHKRALQPQKHSAYKWAMLPFCSVVPVLASLGGCSKFQMLKRTISLRDSQWGLREMVISFLSLVEIVYVRGPYSLETRSLMHTPHNYGSSVHTSWVPSPHPLLFPPSSTAWKFI